MSTHSNAYQSIQSGLIASSCSILLCYPLDTIKNKLQIGGPIFSRHYYRGILAELSGNIPSTITFWGTYQLCRDHQLSIQQSSFLSACTSNLIDTPFDIMKKKRQIHISESILKREHISKILKFSIMNMSHSVLYNMIYMPMLNYLKNEKGYNNTVSIASCCTLASTNNPTGKLSPFLKGLGTRIIYGNIYSGCYMHIYLWWSNGKL
jgi:hypothetical protein